MGELCKHKSWRLFLRAGREAKDRDHSQVNEGYW